MRHDFEEKCSQIHVLATVRQIVRFGEEHGSQLSSQNKKPEIPHTVGREKLNISSIISAISSILSVFVFIKL